MWFKKTQVDEGVPVIGNVDRVESTTRPSPRDATRNDGVWKPEIWT